MTSENEDRRRDDSDRKDLDLETEQLEQAKSAIAGGSAETSEIAAPDDNLDDEQLPATP